MLFHEPFERWRRRGGFELAVFQVAEELPNTVGERVRAVSGHAVAGSRDHDQAGSRHLARCPLGNFLREHIAFRTADQERWHAHAPEERPGVVIRCFAAGAIGAGGVSTAL